MFFSILVHSFFERHVDLVQLRRFLSLRFFFNDTATTEIYTLSLHDALPIYADQALPPPAITGGWDAGRHIRIDRKSTRLNSSHSSISYAVFCLKKKKRT